MIKGAGIQSVSNATLSAEIAGGTSKGVRSSSAGIYLGGTGIIGIPQGIVLTSGGVQDIAGPNSSGNRTQDNATPGDAHLAALIGASAGNLHDTTILEFDFVPTHPVLAFRYVFGSEEYNEFANSGFNDVFGFFVNGTAPANNVARIPGTTDPVSINNVNGGRPLGTGARNPQYYINNSPGVLNTELDGMTVTLTAQVPVNVGVVNHIKIAIADVLDGAWDSYVFIEESSFISGNAPVAVADSYTVPGGGTFTAPAGSLLTNDTDVDNNLASAQVISQPTNGTLVFNTNGGFTYTPTSGYSGPDSFTYQALDSTFIQSNVATVSLTVATVETEPVITTGEFAGPAGTGAEIAGAPAGTKFVQFTGTPALGDGGVAAYNAIIRNPNNTQSRALLTGNPPTILVRDSDDVSGMTSFSGTIPAGTKFLTFRDPLVNGSGRIAFMAELNHTTLIGNNARGFFTNVADGTMKMLMRIGAPDPNGNIYSNTGVITMSGNGVIFTAYTTDGQMGLYGFDPVRGVETLFRTGNTVSSGGSNKVVQSFSILSTSGYVTGQGQEHTLNELTGDRHTSLVCTFTDATQGIIKGKFDATSGNYSGFTETFVEKGRLVDFQAGGLGTLPLAKFSHNFRMQGRDQKGEFFGFLANMQNGVGGVTGTSDAGLFLDVAPEELVLQVREGDSAVGITGGTFKDFYTLMVGSGDYEFAFMADVRGSGITGANDLGIWAKHSTSGMQLIAREGSEAPGVAGSRFQNFNQMALPAEGQPIINSTLAIGFGGVTSTNDNGLWVMNSSGSLKLAVREGDTFTVGGSTRTVSTIQSLGSGNSNAIGSRIFTNDGFMKILLGFTDGTQAYVQVSVP